MNEVRRVIRLVSWRLWFVDFIRTSKRGVILRRPTRRAEELVAEE